jgi:hypothetical protein
MTLRIKESRFLRKKLSGSFYEIALIEKVYKEYKRLTGDEHERLLMNVKQHNHD